MADGKAEPDHEDHAQQPDGAAAVRILPQLATTSSRISGEPSAMAGNPDAAPDQAPPAAAWRIIAITLESV
jgi:hypothetical protein